MHVSIASLGRLSWSRDPFLGHTKLCIAEESYVGCQCCAAPCSVLLWEASRA